MQIKSEFEPNPSFVPLPVRHISVIDIDTVNSVTTRSSVFSLLRYTIVSRLNSQTEHICHVFLDRDEPCATLPSTSFNYYLKRSCVRTLTVLPRVE